MTTEGQEPNPQGQEPQGQPQMEPEKTNTEEWPESAKARIKELNAEAAKYRKEKEAALKAQETAQAAALEEQGKFKELYEAEMKKAADAAAKLAQLEHDQLRRDAAQAAGIPSLWQRLQGSTLEELTEDAQALAAMTRPAAPSLDGGAGGNRGVATVTEQEIEELAARWRVDPQHIDRAAVARMNKR
jgi:hypothetical protein